MTIGLPVEIDLSTITTDVYDGTEVYNYLNKQDFRNGKTLRQGDNIYVNTADDISVADYDAGFTYIGGEIVHGDPYAVGYDHLLVAVETTGEVPKWAYEYSATDSGLNYSTWVNKYSTIATTFSDEATFSLGDVEWKIRDLYNGYANITIRKNSILYVNKDIPLLRSLMVGFQDIPATLFSTATPAVYDFFVPEVLMFDGVGLQVRTHLDIETEYKTSTAIAFDTVHYLGSISGFSFIEKSNNIKPFDGKNYTQAKAQGSLQYSFKSLQDFNSIALGGLICKKATITVSTPTKTITKTIVVDASRDINSILPMKETTEIIYISENIQDMYGSDAQVTILLSSETTANGVTTYGDVAVGTILLAQSVDVGFTNLAITNAYKDYSTFEYDTWGNVDYVDRARVSTYNATVDIEIENYDMTDRFMKSIGKQVVAIDGSDSIYGGDDIFKSTQKLGRILSYSQRTKATNNSLDKVAQYSLSIEEIA